MWKPVSALTHCTSVSRVSPVHVLTNVGAAATLPVCSDTAVSSVCRGSVSDSVLSGVCPELQGRGLRVILHLIF